MVTVTNRISAGERFQQWSRIDLPRRTAIFSRGAGNIAQHLGLLLRRLALISFFETMIATYLVHRAAAASIAVNNNVGTIMVLLVGTFLTILLCAAAWMVSGG